MRCLALDPGRSTGWAYLEDRRLVACGACEGGVAPYAHPSLFDRVIIEKPQVYPSDPVDPNDLITLAVVVGEYKHTYEAAGAKVFLVLPREWKGQIPKPKHHPRIWAALKTANEQIACQEGGKGLRQKALGDMMDAIGLGQYAVNMGIFL